MGVTVVTSDATIQVNTSQKVITGFGIVENTDKTYEDTVDAGDTLIIPDITITKNDDSTTTSPAAIDLDLRIIDPLPWTPEELKNANRDVVNWWNARESNVLNGSDLSHYIDQSGDGNHFAQTTPSAQPAFTGSDETSLITHDGVGEFLSQPVNSGNYQNLTYFEYWTVIDNDGTLQRTASFGDDSVITDYIELAILAAGEVRLIGFDNSVNNSVQTTSAISSGKHVGGFIFDGTLWKIIIDKVDTALSINFGTNTGNFIGSFTNKINFDLANIGKRVGGANYGNNKERFSLAIGGTSTAAATTTAEQTEIFDYINAQFNLGL